MKDYPLVSIISIHFNVIEETLEFLDSCSRLTYPNFEVIIVDNGSKVAFDREISDPKVKLVRSEKNTGFAGGNNIGYQQSKGEYVFFLNNDTLLQPDFIQPIVAFLSSHEEVGALSPKVLYPDGKTIQYAGSMAINTFTGRGRRIGKMETDVGQFDEVKETELGHGSAFIVPRRVIMDVGLMPELYFLYYEEHDWCERIKEKGYKIYYFGTSSIIHKESMTTGKESTLKTYYMARNRIIYMKRNSHGPRYFIGLIFLILISLPKNVLSYLFKGKTDLCKAYVRGYFWHLGKSSHQLSPGIR